MAYTPQTRIDSRPQGGWTRAAIEAEARRRGAVRWDDLMDVLDEYFGQTFINPEIAAIQSAHETAWWTSAWYRDRLNLAGIGITGDPAQNTASKTWASGRDAARAHLTHLWLYARGTDLPAGFPGSPAEDPRWPNAVAAGYAGTKSTIGSLTNTWAIDSAYGDKLVAILNQRPASQQPPAGGNEGRPVMGYKAYDLPGFPRNPVYLPDWIEVQIKIIPSSVAGWTSGQKLSGQTKTTWHDTGNPSSSAASEYGWAAGGGRAGINSPGSYNGIFDKDRIIITQRFDELVGHAGVPEGNRKGWAFEQAFGPGFEASLPVGAALHGGICAAMGWSVDTALVQHRYWSGKWCPGQILNRNLWSQVVAMTSDAALKAAAAALGGKLPDTPTPETPIYAKPVPIPELEAYRGKAEAEIPYRVDGDGWVALYVGDRVKAVRDTPRRRYSTGDELVGGPVKAGEEFDVDWLLISAEFPDTYYTPWATRITAGDTARVADVKAA